MEPLQNRELTEPLRVITRHASLTYFRKHLSRWQFHALCTIVKTEARLRSALHRLRGRTDKANMMACLIELTDFMQQGEEALARQTLEHLLRIAGMTRPKAAA